MDRRDTERILRIQTERPTMRLGQKTLLRLLINIARGADNAERYIQPLEPDPGNAGAGKRYRITGKANPYFTWFDETPLRAGPEAAFLVTEYTWFCVTLNP